MDLSSLHYNHRSRNVNGDNGEIEERSSMENVNSGRNPIALMSVLLAMLVQMKCECDHNKREVDKLKKGADLLKEEILRMKNEKGPPISDDNDGERMITGSSPLQLNEQELTPPFDAENPFFEACGIRISLRGFTHPESVTIHHSLPNDLEHFDVLRQEGTNFDKTIKIGDFTMNVHRALLGARIPFFMNLLGSNWSESSSDLITFSSEYNSTVIENLINWAYGGVLSINLNIVQELMRTAAYLLLEEIVEECYKFMRKRIEYDGALPLLYYCRAIDFNRKDESLMKFIESNFVPISLTPEFLDLPFDDLKKIIDRDSLNVDDEKQVFDAVDRWMEKDKKRKIFGPNLFELIRCSFLSPSFLTQIVSKKNWIMDNPGSIDIINERLGIGKNSFISLKTTRRTNNVHNLILVISANRDYDEHNDEWSRFDLFDPLKIEWHSGLIECRNLFDNNDVVVVGDKIHFMGHKCNEETYAFDEGTMISLNIRTNQWNTVLMPSLVRRSGGVHGNIDGIVYSAGNENSYSNQLTSFDPSNPSAGWKTLANMKKSRSWAASCVSNGKLFVIGGYATEGGGSRRDGEYYCPATNEWTTTSLLKKSSVCSGAAVLNGEIYVVGGGQYRSSSAALQKYSPETDSWTELSSMKYPRRNPLVVASGGKLIVCGGGSDDGVSRAVEQYDPATDVWDVLEPMREFRGRPIMIAIPVPASYPTPNLEKSTEVDNN